MKNGKMNYEDKTTNSLALVPVTSNGLHLYVSSKLKSFYSFKPSDGPVGYDEQFLYPAVGAPGSTHYARMLKSTCIYREIVYAEITSERKLHLEGGGEIPILTVSNSAFPRHPWLLKG